VSEPVLTLTLRVDCIEDGKKRIYYHACAGILDRSYPAIRRWLEEHVAEVLEPTEEAQ
jgi:hypothetical protein